MSTIAKIFVLIFCVFSPLLANAGRLEDYPTVEKTWGNVLNPSNSIPDKDFQVYYINTNHPKKVIATEKAKNIVVDYAYNELYNINAEHFGAYWIGKVVINQDGLYQLNVKQSRAKSRIFIDKHIVFSSDDDGSDVIHLKKGTYTLEVEHINNWHTANVIVTLHPLVKVINKLDLQQEIAKLNLPQESVVHVVSISDSDSTKNNVFVQVDDTQKPYIIFLNSSDGVTWDIKDNKPALIIYNNANEGSIVKADEDIPIMAWDGDISYRIADRGDLECSCDE